MTEIRKLIAGGLVYTESTASKIAPHRPVNGLPPNPSKGPVARPPHGPSCARAVGSEPPRLEPDWAEFYLAGADEVDAWLRSLTEEDWNEIEARGRLIDTEIETAAGDLMHSVLDVDRMFEQAREALL